MTAPHYVMSHDNDTTGMLTAIASFTLTEPRPREYMRKIEPSVDRYLWMSHVFGPTLGPIIYSALRHQQTAGAASIVDYLRARFTAAEIEDGRTKYYKHMSNLGHLPVQVGASLSLSPLRACVRSFVADVASPFHRRQCRRVEIDERRHKKTVHGLIVGRREGRGAAQLRLHMVSCRRQERRRCCHWQRKSRTPRACAVQADHCEEGYGSRWKGNTRARSQS